MTLCRSNNVKSSQLHLDATMRAIYESIIEMEAELQNYQDHYGVKVRELSSE